MSIFFDRLKSSPILEEIDQEKTNFSFGRSEGAPYLFFRGEEHQDLMGHEIKYYNSGVLLVFKDKHKEHENENSFMFFNNDGKQVFSWSNIIYNGYNARKQPENKINIVVRESFLQVEILNLKGEKLDEYFVSVKSGQKLYDIFEKKENESNLTL